MASQRKDTCHTSPAFEACVSGIASWYGPELQGRRTASGEIFDRGEMTAAHPSLPFHTRLRITNLANGRTVIVRVNDRGPGYGRLIDLSEAAAKRLGMHERGFAKVEIRVEMGAGRGDETRPQRKPAPPRYRDTVTTLSAAHF